MLAANKSAYTNEKEVFPKKITFSTYQELINLYEVNSAVVYCVLQSVKIHLQELKVWLLEYCPDDIDDFTKRGGLHPIDKSSALTSKLPVMTLRRCQQKMFGTDALEI